MVSISKGPLAVACNSMPCNIQCSLFSNALFGVLSLNLFQLGQTLTVTYVQRPEFMACKTKCSDVLLTPEQ